MDLNQQIKITRTSYLNKQLHYPYIFSPVVYVFYKVSKMNKGFSRLKLPSFMKLIFKSRSYDRTQDD